MSFTVEYRHSVHCQHTDIFSCKNYLKTRVVRTDTDVKKAQVLHRFRVNLEHFDYNGGSAAAQKCRFFFKNE